MSLQDSWVDMIRINEMRTHHNDRPHPVRAYLRQQIVGESLPTIQIFTRRRFSAVALVGPRFLPIDAQVDHPVPDGRKGHNTGATHADVDS
jgi:hypothetical protein